MFTWPEFEKPEWLLLLPVVIALLVWRWRRQPAALPFPDISVAVAINTRKGVMARWAGTIFRGLALSALVLALAGPRWPDEGTRIPTEGIAILLVVDVSNSMNEPDFQWDGQSISRLQAMKRAFRLLIAGGKGPHGEELVGRPNDLVGLVSFTRLPKSSCPLTLSHAALLEILDREESNKGGHDIETNIGDAIAWGVHRLNTTHYQRKMMVLITDGEQGEIPDALKPREAAQLAGHYKIPILVIDPGSDAILHSKTAADQLAAENRRNAKTTMNEVASMTGGEYRSANDSKALFEVLASLAERLNIVQREEIETFRYRKYWESFTWLAGSGFVLWWMLMALELTVWRRIP